MTADDESHGTAMIDIIEQRMQENAALRAENRQLREALRNLVTFDSRAYVKQSELARDLLVVRKAAKIALALESDNAQS